MPFTNNFDALVAELSGDGSPNDSEVFFSKASRIASEAEMHATLSELDRARERMVQIGKPTRQQRIDGVRSRLATAHQMLKGMLADGIIQKGGATAEQIIGAEQRIHSMAHHLDMLEAGGPESGNPPAPHSGMPDGLNAAAFRPRLHAAMKNGRIAPQEAVHAEACMMRGDPPDPEVVRRVMAA